MKNKKVFVQVFLKSRSEWVRSVNEEKISSTKDSIKIGNAEFDRDKVDSVFVNRVEVNL